MLTIAKEYLTDVFNLFYPRVCLSCSGNLLRDETVVCYKCESDLPLTEHWNNPDNQLAQRLWGRLNLQAAAAMYRFHKNSGVQHLLHQLKYRSRKDAGVYMGNKIGRQLQQADCIIKPFDLIVPVPLHWKKLKTRSYNQCDCIAEGLSEITGVAYSASALERVSENVSQTGKNKYERWENVSGIFAVADAEQLKGKHILVVDDVITTGATAEACLQTVLSVPDTKVSFVAAAYAMG